MEKHLSVFSEEEHETLEEILNKSSFDEKFEIDLEKDLVTNIYHVENKYFIPVAQAGYREMFQYFQEVTEKDGDVRADDFLNPETIVERFEHAKPRGILKAECRQMLVDGNYRWVQYLGIYGAEHGVPDGIIFFYVYDIQNQKERMMGKTPRAMNIDRRDELTGLYVGDMFVHMAKDLMIRKKGPWCCVGIDIQHFKVFKSWYGEEKGRYLLSKIGAVLRRFEKKWDAVSAYFSHDIFGVFMRYDPDRIEDIYHEIEDVTRIYSKTVAFLPAIGVYVLEENETITIDTYEKARFMVKEVKQSYSERIRYFDSNRYHEEMEKYQLLSDFQTAMLKKEIQFYVQPQCLIDSGNIVGAEALVRWIKEDGTVISPGVFVPLLESTGFIAEMDKFVWDSVCQWIRDLLDRGYTPVPVSVNVSQADLLSMDVAAYMYSLTERYNIPTKLLKVEITESAYAENFEVITDTIQELRKKGFSVLLDDFGSGYSSLNMLDKIDVDALKLDMAFMKSDSISSKKGISIVESIISMTKILDVPVVIEGVENITQIRSLDQMGCKYAQGYYFYRPMPVSEYEELLKQEEKMDYDGFISRSTDLFHARDFLSENMFTDTTLNSILGAVAYYTLEGNDLTIHRFNEPFYRAIGDAKMDGRRTAIQNYVVKEDWPMLYGALESAENHVAEGGSCEIRFYKSDNSVFWFHMRFFFLKANNKQKLFYGQVEDVTQMREQSISFFEVLRKQSAVTMRMNLEQNIIQYVIGSNTLFQYDLPCMPLDESVRRTAQSRIEDLEDQKAFIEFFDVERLMSTYRKAIYHETIELGFKLRGYTEPVEFSTYYIRYNQDQDLMVYAFAIPKNQRYEVHEVELSGLSKK